MTVQWLSTRQRRALELDLGHRSGPVAFFKTRQRRPLDLWTWAQVRWSKVQSQVRPAAFFKTRQTRPLDLWTFGPGPRSKGPMVQWSSVLCLKEGEAGHRIGPGIGLGPGPVGPAVFFALSYGRRGRPRDRTWDRTWPRCGWSGGLLCLVLRKEKKATGPDLGPDLGPGPVVAGFL